MKLTKCNNKHFYDADKYEECPHCAKKRLSAGSPSHTGNTVQKTLSLGQVSSPQKGHSNTVSIQDANETPADDVSTFESLAADSQVDLESISQELFSPPTVSSDVPLISGQDIDESTPITMTQQEAILSPALESPPYDASDFSTGGTSPKVSDFAQAVASSSMSVHTNPNQGQGDKTVAFYDIGGVAPVVGWLICVIGEYVGESFNLKAGQNFIGRSLSMDIALVNEKSISREFHAGIIFDPNSKQFYAVPGQSNGLTYINGNLLFSATPLKSYDMLQLGKSTYIFMAFSGQEFSWETYIG